MQQCYRCGGDIGTSDARQVMYGKVYHTSCMWAIKEKLRKEREDANNLQSGNWHNNQPPPIRNGGSTPTD